jgi:hypothetical protein
MAASDFSAQVHTGTYTARVTALSFTTSHSIDGPSEPFGRYSRRFCWTVAFELASKPLNMSSWTRRGSPIFPYAPEKASPDCPPGSSVRL